MREGFGGYAARHTAQWCAMEAPRTRPGGSVSTPRAIRRSGARWKHRAPKGQRDAPGYAAQCSVTQGKTPARRRALLASPFDAIRHRSQTVRQRREHGARRADYSDRVSNMLGYQSRSLIIHCPTTLFPAQTSLHTAHCQSTYPFLLLHGSPTRNDIDKSISAYHRRPSSCHLVILSSCRSFPRHKPLQTVLQALPFLSLMFSCYNCLTPSPPCSRLPWGRFCYTVGPQPDRDWPCSNMQLPF
jgi:hypothetical protein